MISIARRNFSYFLNPNSHLCNFNLRFLHRFSTSASKTLIHNPEIRDVLVNKHLFSPEFASLVSSSLSKFASPKSADSILKFLKSSSFTTAQLEKIVIYNSRVLGFTIERMKFKFKVFQELGLSPEEIAKLVYQAPGILHSSMEKKIIPNVAWLKGFLAPDHDVASILRKSSWFLRSDLEKTLMPNVEILKSYDVPMKIIIPYLYHLPRYFLIKPHVMRESLDKAIQFGFSPTSTLFIRAASVLSKMSGGMWEVGMQRFRELGFSDDDILTMFRKQPFVLCTSPKKAKNVKEILLTTGKYSMSDIVSNPSSLGYSIEKRYEPRLQICRLLESRRLIENWPAIFMICGYTDVKFFNSFVRPYYNEIGEEDIIKKYVEGKKKLKLCADA